MREAFESRARERLRDVEPLPSPEALRRSVQAPARTAAIVQQGRRALRDLLHGEDDRRLAVIIGPRSLHDPALALEYASAELKNDTEVVLAAKNSVLAAVAQQLGGVG